MLLRDPAALRDCCVDVVDEAFIGLAPALQVELQHVQARAEHRFAIPIICAEACVESEGCVFELAGSMLYGERAAGPEKGLGQETTRCRNKGERNYARRIHGHHQNATTLRASLSTTANIV